MLRRFADSHGRLTVVHVRPQARVLRRQAPENIGAKNRLNSIKTPEGAWDDVLEAEPLAKLDTLGAAAVREVVAYAGAVEPAGALRLWNREWRERLPLTMTIAGLMVRGPGTRQRLDDQALP